MSKPSYFHMIFCATGLTFVTIQHQDDPISDFFTSEVQRLWTIPFGDSFFFGILVVSPSMVSP